MGPSSPSYSGIVILLLLGNCGEESSLKARSLGLSLHDCQPRASPVDAVGAVEVVTLTGARGPGDMREHLLSHVGGNYHHWVSPGFTTSARLEIRLSVHSPILHTTPHRAFAYSKCKGQYPNRINIHIGTAPSTLLV